MRVKCWVDGLSALWCHNRVDFAHGVGRELTEFLVAFTVHACTWDRALATPDVHELSFQINRLSQGWALRRHFPHQVDLGLGA